jgi:hypothetical protein
VLSAAARRGALGSVSFQEKLPVLPASHPPARDQLDVLLERFNQAWQAGSRPSMEQHLSDTSVERLALLRGLIATDLHYRLRAGEAARVEEYLQRFPELNGDAGTVAALIAAEYRQRQQVGQQPALAEYLERFPHHREQLLPTLLADSQATEAAARGAESAADTTLPVLDGRFRTDRFLARGGMGEVYRILDATFQRPLALKVLQARFRGRVHIEERFLREALLTGRLQHPGIPPVQEMGRLADGRPYFIMKLIQGRDLRTLLGERDTPLEQQGYYLGVFEQVCRTVAYAHAQGILHRDLKPANIMVGAFGEVQVMDWGLAKSLTAAAPIAEPATSPTSSTIQYVRPAEVPDTASVAGDVIGTPAYMAPEQARGEVEQLDRTCDVFGLGGILCEILTGRPPFATGDKLADQRRAMRGDLSEAFARLDGCGADAELIALARRCLAPERQDRPSSAAVVAQATAAYQEVVRERLRQAEVARGQALVRVEEQRKRLGVERQKRRVTLVLASAVLLVLLAGVAATTVALVRAWEQTERAETAEGEAKDHAALAEERRGQAAREQARAVGAEADAKAKAKLAEERRQEAEQQTQLAATEARKAKEQAEIARKVKDYLVAAFRNPDPFVPGDKVTVAQILRQAEQEIARLDQPLLQEELLTTIGWTYLNLKLPEAIRVWEQVVALQSKRLGPDDPDTLASMNNLGVAYQADGQVKRALALFELTLANARRLLGPDHPETLAGMNNLAGAYQADGQVKKALPLYQALLEKRQGTLGPDHPDTLHSMHDLATAYQGDGQVKKALPLFEEVLQKNKSLLGADHPHTLTIMYNLAMAYQADGQLKLALPLLADTLQKRKGKLGPDHPDTLRTMNALAQMYREAGQLKKALPLFEDTLEKYKLTLGPDHVETLHCLNNLALACREAGQLQRALTLLEEILEKHKLKLGADHPDTLTSMNNLASTYQADGQLSKALPLYEEALAKQKVKVGADHPDTLRTMNNLANAYRASGQLQKALPLLEEVVEKRKLKLGADHPATMISMNNLGVAYWQAGLLDRSVPLFEETLRLRLAKLGQDHPDTLQSMANLAVNYRDAGRVMEAIRLLEECLDRAYKRPGGFPAQLVWVQPTMAATYEAGSMFAKAEPLHRSFLQQAQTQFNAGDPRISNYQAQLAWNLLHQMKYAAAEPLLRDCLKVREQKQPDAWTTFNTQSMLGACLLGQKKYAAAEPLLLQGYEGMKQRAAQIPKASQLHLREALDWLVELYEAWGKQDEAARWRAVRDGKSPQARNFEMRCQWILTVAGKLDVNGQTQAELAPAGDTMALVGHKFFE